MGMSYELDAIAAAVIGGTSLSGGLGTIGGAVVAVPNDSFKPAEMLNPFYEYVTNDKIRSFPYIPNTEVANALMVGTQNMFLGKASPEDVVADMQKAVKAE